MIFIIPLIFGAIGAAVGAVAGAFVTHASGESDRQAAQHHREVANELTNKFTALERRYHKLADQSQQQIHELTRQRALDAVEKDCLRLAVRLQQHLLTLMQDIDREPVLDSLSCFKEAVEVTNAVLQELKEDLIFVPADYYVRNSLRAIKGEEQLPLIAGKHSPKLSPSKKRRKNKPMNPQKEMTPVEFTETYNRISESGDRILQFLKEMRAGRLTEGNKTEGLQSVENNLIKTLKALQEQRYQVAVIAAMKAGKSTFLNSLIGADVLASESEACTVCRTDIRPLPAGETPKLLEYREREDGRTQVVTLVEGTAEEIRQKFLERTHKIRATSNQDWVVKFELYHPIDAIKESPSLAGFTLVDTPGPNEWESAFFDTVKLKETALEALRTCDVILFILDYTSFKDNTNSELLKDLIEKRSDFLRHSAGKIYFILNKVDRKAEGDRDIELVVKDLRQALTGFGIPEPIIYPVSAWQGLLAKLIQQKVETENHLKNFKKFFSARYAQENEEGDLVIPSPRKIAPQALEDSLIPTVERSVIQSIVQKSGWNLLKNVLLELDKYSKQIEIYLVTSIAGWGTELSQLQQQVDEYARRSDSARRKVEQVKKSVDAQSQKLVDEFSQEVGKFAETAKARIEFEIERFVKDGSYTSGERASKGDSFRGERLSNPIFSGIVDAIQEIGKGLRDSLEGIIRSEQLSTKDPYVIRLRDRKKAEKVGDEINNFCTPIIYEFWLETQDQLMRQGATIREDLTAKLEKDIQAISDELSAYLGRILEVEIENNPIQFPSFDFSGIDAKVQHQQEVFTRTRKETRKKKRCCKSSKSYEVDVPYQETISYYEVDLRQVQEAISQKIDEQVERTLILLERVIEKQVQEDFSKAKQQIEDYINLFQCEFDNLVFQRANYEAEAPQIIAYLEHQKEVLGQDMEELAVIGELLESCQPV